MENPDPIASIVVKIADDTQESFERLIQSLQDATKAIEQFLNLLQKESETNLETSTTPVIQEGRFGTQDER